MHVTFLGIDHYAYLQPAEIMVVIRDLLLQSSITAVSCGFSTLIVTTSNPLIQVISHVLMLAAQSIMKMLLTFNNELLQYIGNRCETIKFRKHSRPSIVQVQSKEWSSTICHG